MPAQAVQHHNLASAHTGGQLTHQCAQVEQVGGRKVGHREVDDQGIVVGNLASRQDAAQVSRVLVEPELIGGPLADQRHKHAHSHVQQRVQLGRVAVGEGAEQHVARHQPVGGIGGACVRLYCNCGWRSCTCVPSGPAQHRRIRRPSSRPERPPRHRQRDHGWAATAADRTTCCGGRRRRGRGSRRRLGALGFYVRGSQRGLGLGRGRRGRRRGWRAACSRGPLAAAAVRCLVHRRTTQVLWYGASAQQRVEEGEGAVWEGGARE
mmetsp:Transcript_13822/g.44241  ORF Transcript_13822/g.44241 Transcript_13822/m.44241 type:complete len:265 (+) Transcript_13822:300-1094(+)